VSYSYVGRKRW